MEDTTIKKYRFYGWETADVQAHAELFPTIRTPRDLYDALSGIWCEYTCAPRMRKDWSPENKTLGQCSITAFLAQDIFGGKVYGIPLPDGGYHCYNVVDGCLFDLTSEQFGNEVLNYEDNPEQFREVHFTKEEKRLRYEYLKDELRKREDLYLKIQAFTPCNEQEERDRRLLLKWLTQNRTVWKRDNPTAHLTASAWVVSPERDRVLMAYHNIYRSWSWLGGHADGESDLSAVALREVKEESGLSQVRLVSPQIYSLEILTVDGHEKKGKYVSSHLHLNVTFLVEADPLEPLSIKPDENSSIAWFSPEEAVERSTEPWFRERIYSKLNEKLKSSMGCQFH